MGARDAEDIVSYEEEASQEIIEGALTALSGHMSAAPKEQIKSTLDYLVAINEREKKVIRDFKKYEFSMSDGEILSLEGIGHRTIPIRWMIGFASQDCKRRRSPAPPENRAKDWLIIRKSPHTQPITHESIIVEVDGENEEILWEDAVLEDSALEFSRKLLQSKSGRHGLALRLSVIK